MTQINFLLSSKSHQRPVISSGALFRRDPAQSSIERNECIIGIIPSRTRSKGAMNRRFKYSRVNPLFNFGFSNPVSHTVRAFFGHHYGDCFPLGA